MRWKMAAMGVLAAALLPSLPAADPARVVQAKPPAEAAPVTGAAARSFQHPVRKFVIPVPRGVEVSEPDKDRVVLDSRQGYRIIVQTNDANPEIPLPRLNDKFEAQYLGETKPLALKLDEQPATVAGMPAIDAKYQGANSLARLVMARGRKTDFVFMFFAPPDRYEKLQLEFQWLLDSFRPNPSELPAGQATLAAPAAVAAARRFEDAGYGYAIQYPADWRVAKPSAAIATFSGPRGTDAYFAMVSIQNVQPPAATSSAQATEAAIADQKAMLEREARDVVLHGEQPLTYKSGRLSLAGRQMLVTYSFGGERYRRWAIVVPRPAGTVTHVWTYTAPESKFETFRPIADAMLKSWTIRPDGPRGNGG